jgi:hypothetical protein
MKCEREIVLLLLRCCGMKDVLVFQNKSTVSDRGNWHESLVFQNKHAAERGGAIVSEIRVGCCEVCFRLARHGCG